MKIDPELEEDRKKLAEFCDEVKRIALKLHIDSYVFVVEQGEASRIEWSGHDECGEPECLECSARVLESTAHNMLSIADAMLHEDEDEGDDGIPDTELN